MDFIKRETVCEELNDIGGCGADPNSWADGWDRAISAAIKIVKDTPAADAFEVVRCKDCIYYNYIDNYCDLFGFDLPGENFYCRDGERDE